MMAAVLSFICMSGCGDSSTTQEISTAEAGTGVSTSAAINTSTAITTAEQIAAEPIIKERPDEGDLIKSETFYAQLPKNRYGGHSEEGDYAEGKFIIWVNRVKLSESGDIIGRDNIVVPYIVGEGNDENLSMLSGGNDGDKPYGDDIWVITTNEKGEIVDAVFYK